MGPFSSGFSTVVETGLISKSLKSGMKSILDSEPLSKTTLLGLG